MKIFILLFLLIASPASFATHHNNDENVESSDKYLAVSDVRPWWIGDLLTVLSIFAGVGLIVFQLNRQHINDVETQKENNRDQLRLEIYQEFSLGLKNTNNKTSDAGMYAFLLTSNITNYTEQIGLGVIQPPLKYRANEFSDLHYSSNKSIIALIILIEKYEIVSPELDIFKTALNAALYDISEAFMPLFQFLLRILPMDFTDNEGNPGHLNVITPTQAQIDELSHLVNAYKNAHDDLGGYLFDLNVELQRVFLSRLFENEVKIREPIDPNIKVVTTDPAEIERLKLYFEEETPWGIHKREVEEDVRNNIQNL